MNYLKKNYHLLIIVVIFLFHAINNYIFLRMDNQLPFDDYAMHLLGALNIATHSNNWFSMITFGMNSMIRGFYPPLFDVSMAIFNRLFGHDKIFAIMANIPFLGLLLMSVYLIGKKMGNKSAGVFAAFLISMYPMLFEMSRLPLTGFSLTAMVSLSVCCLLYSDDFQNRFYSVLFGVSIGLGMLTKQVFILFLVGSLIVTLAFMLYNRYFFERKRIVNLVYSALIALLIPAYLYLPRLVKLWQNYVRTGFAEAQEYPFRYPAIISFDSMLYYLKALIGAQVLPFMLLVFVVCAVIWFFQKRDHKFKILFFSSIILTYMIFTLIAMKEPNSTVSYLIFFALITSCGLFSIRINWIKYCAVSVVVIFCLCQYFDIGYKNGIFFSHIRNLPYASVLAPTLPLQPPLGMDVSLEPRYADWKVKEVVSFLRSKQKDHQGMLVGVSDFDARRQNAKVDNFIMTNKTTYEYLFRLYDLPFTVVSLRQEFGSNRTLEIAGNKLMAYPDILILENKNIQQYLPRLDIAKRYEYATELTLPDTTSIYFYEKTTH